MNHRELEAARQHMANVAAAQHNSDPALIYALVLALEAADLYLNSYDTSKPSRIKAETRAAVAEALEKAARSGAARRATWVA